MLPVRCNSTSRSGPRGCRGPPMAAGAGSAHATLVPGTVLRLGMTPRAAGGRPWPHGHAAVVHTRHAAVTHAALPHAAHRSTDRKSTRLNSSHSQISYAVFCL